MALTILSNLSYNGKNPNFERDRVATLEALLYVNPANQEYDYGHIVFCIEDGKHYRFMHKYGAPDEANYNDTTGWFQELATGGSGGSIDTSNFATISDLASKQDVIGDLATIRSGAANGATAVQTVRINNEPFTQPESGKLTLQFKTINNQSITGSGNIEIGSGSSGGGIISETDPVFKASAAANINQSDIDSWNNKSDFSGNYNDLSNKPTIPSAVTESTVTDWGFTKNKGTVTSVKINGVAKSPDSRGEVDLGTVQSGSGDTYINGVTDVIVDGATVVRDNVATIPLASTSNAGVVQLSNDVDSDSETKAASSAAVKTVNDKVNGKQDVIDDLEEIKTNAANAFKGSINGVSEGTFWLATKVNGIAPNGEGEVTIPVGDENVQSDWNATSGDAFIKNKPTIPTTLSQLAQSASYRTVTDTEKNTWNAKLDKNTADNSYLGKNDKATSATNADNATNDGNGDNISNTYATKAALSGGLAGKQDVISDLANIREKADKAFIGSINGSKNGGFFTVEKIVMNGNDYPREGSFTHIDLGTVLTEHQDLSDYLTTTTAANTYLKKTANAASATKATQDGNGNNIADTYATKSELANINVAYPLVNHGTSDKTFTLTPNVFHVWDNVDSLTLTLGSGTEGVANEYLFQFSCLSDQATTLGLPSGIQWANGEAPTLEVLKTYQVSILNNCATYVSFG